MVKDGSGPLKTEPSGPAGASLLQTRWRSCHNVKASNRTWCIVANHRNHVLDHTHSYPPSDSCPAMSVCRRWS